MDIWLTAQECIGLPNMPTAPFNISNRLKKLATADMMRKRQGTKAIEFHINCLPPVDRATVLRRRGTVEVNNQQIAIIPRTKADSYCRDALWQRMNNASDKQRDKASQKCEAVTAAASLIDSGIDTFTAFDSVAQAMELSSANVRRWYYTAIKFDRSDWLPALLGKYSDRQNAKDAEFTAAAWDFLAADYLRPERPALNVCYLRLLDAAKAHGWTIPSLSSVRRKIERDIPAEQRVLLREGEHALMRLYPAQQRSVLELEAMEWINGDGYQHNVFVKWFNGEVLRPKTWIWQDIRTRKILAYRTDVSENSDVIRLSLADLVEQYGIPKHLTIDNTRAAANKWMTGGVKNRYRFKVKEDDPLGIIPLLGIQLHWTSVLFGRGHGQAKPIERAFSHGGLGEMVDKHPLNAGAYTGDNPMAKPDNYGSRVIDAADFMKTLAQGIALFNSRVGRETEACDGKLSFDEAFAESYATATVRKATAEQRRLLLLPAEAVRVSESGTFILEAGGAVRQRKNRYFSEDLIGIKPNKIVIRFDPQSLHESVLAYTLDGRFIAEARCIEATGFGDTHAAREHKRHRTQYTKRVKEAAAAAKVMDALEVAELMPDTQGPAPVETKIVELFRPVGNTMRRELVETDLDIDNAFSAGVSQLFQKQLDSQI